LLAAQCVEGNGGATDPHAKNSPLQLLLQGSQMVTEYCTVCWVGKF